MKRITLIAMLLLTGMAQNSFARNGYRIQVRFTDMKDTLVYLAHYYGKPLPTVYKADSAHFDKNGVATLESKDKIIGGIYLIFPSNKSKYFDFLLNNGDDMSITATMKDLPEGLKFKNSPENEHYLEFIAHTKPMGEEEQKLQASLKDAKTSEDTAELRKKMVAEVKKINDYRKEIINKYPNTLLATIFNAGETPEIPEGKHLLPDGKVDSTFNYTYYKNHYWDKFNFHDDRLVYTPIYDGKLDEYMNKIIYQWPDSVEHESDMLLQKTRGSDELFKYTLWWLTHNVEDSKIMGMDEVFVYLVENYYMKGDATWLTPDELKKYTDRASKIAPNVIGNVAPEVKLPNVMTQKEESMLDMKANYTLLIFFSPDCGHCIIEMPKIDSLYRTSLKKKGVKIFAVATEGDQKKIADFIKKNKLEDWIVTWDPEQKGDFRSKYDVYSTPTIYLLDNKKIIRGKRIDHTNIETVIDFNERKNKKSETTKKSSK